MPPDAGEAGHGSKSDAHANLGNHEKHGKSRLRPSASRAVAQNARSSTCDQTSPEGESVWLNNTDDFVTIYAVSIAIEAIKADENIDNKRVETILSEMAALANCLLHTSNLTDDN